MGLLAKAPQNRSNYISEDVLGIRIEKSQTYFV